MQVYITRHALTKGIKVVSVDEATDIRDERLTVRHETGPEIYSHDEWFFSIDDAIENANSRRDKELSRLNFSIAKLKNIRFNESTFT